jgi:hypothetical protein
MNGLNRLCPSKLEEVRKRPRGGKTRKVSARREYERQVAVGST